MILDTLENQENANGLMLRRPSGLALDVSQERADGLRTTLTYQANANTLNNKHEFHIPRREHTTQHHQFQKSPQNQQQASGPTIQKENWDRQMRNAS